MSMKARAKQIVKKELASVHEEVAASWFDSLSQAQKKAYIKAHPNSKYAKKAGGAPAKKDPTDFLKKSPSESHNSYKKRMANRGFRVGDLPVKKAAPSKSVKVPTSRSSNPSDHAERISSQFDFDSGNARLTKIGGKKFVKQSYSSPHASEPDEAISRKEFHEHLIGEGFKHRNGTYTHPNGLTLTPKMNKKGFVSRISSVRPYDPETELDID